MQSEITRERSNFHLLLSYCYKVECTEKETGTKGKTRQTDS